MGKIMGVAWEIRTTDLALVTTAVTTVVTTNTLTVPYETARILIAGWAQLTTGTNTTTVGTSIRRLFNGVLTTVGEINTTTLLAAAGSTEQFWVMQVDALAQQGPINYALVLSQAGATGNGSCLQAGILALLLGS